VGWFYFHCVLALVILVKNYNGTLEDSLNNFEERIGIRTELPPKETGDTVPYYIPPVEEKVDSTWILPERLQIKEGKDSGKKTRVYKSPIGAIPKIVNNISFKTRNQKIFYDIISEDQTQLVLCHGIAGTGKTYISVYKALQDVLRRGTGYDKLIIINPTVDVGNEDKLGYLPGELDKKIQQYNESTFTILDKIVGKDKATKLLSDGKVEISVLNFLRGVNLENCYVILDEAQNVSPMQIKTLMTRISEKCKMIIQGDMSQCDKYKTNGVTNYEKSGFYDAWFRLKGTKGVNHMEFDREDSVRHELVKRILKTYEDEHLIDLEKNMAT